jgi:YD repeat-containing protein
VTSETRTVNAVAHVLAYSYDASGRLSGLTYPSGRTVTYGFDALGRVNVVSTTKDGQTQVVVQNVAYHPFGGVKSFTLGNGQIYSRTIDLDGRIASYSLGGTSYAISFDAASRITGIGANTYGYDDLDRLTSAVLPSSSFGYSYDAVGNRLTKTTGAATDTYAYSSTSNRIASITPASGPVKSFVFDPNGSTTSDGTNTYAYDTKGRMASATSALGTTTYQVNALGQRIRKANSQGDTVFHYDTQGRLIAETDPGGALKRELLYLGDIPVGVIQ